MLYTKHSSPRSRQPTEAIDRQGEPAKVIAHRSKPVHPTTYIVAQATPMSRQHIAAQVREWFRYTPGGDSVPIISGTHSEDKDLTVI